MTCALCHEPFDANGIHKCDESGEVFRERPEMDCGPVYHSACRLCGEYVDGNGLHKCSSTGEVHSFASSPDLFTVVCGKLSHAPQEPEENT